MKKISLNEVFKINSETKQSVADTDSEDIDVSDFDDDDDDVSDWQDFTGNELEPEDDELQQDEPSQLTPDQKKARLDKMKKLHKGSTGEKQVLDPGEQQDLDVDDQMKVVDSKVSGNWRGVLDKAFGGSAKYEHLIDGMVQDGLSDNEIAMEIERLYKVITSKK